MTALDKRRCGPCHACCIVLEIAAPALRKKARVPCRHLSQGGCGIYATRPGVCRQFLCGWRLFEELGDDWRPDRSGVMVMRKAPAELPAGWRHAPYGVHLVVIGGEEAIMRPAFVRYVAQCLARNIPVFLSAASPYILLNAHIAPGVDPAVLKTRLAELYALLHAARFGRSLWKRLPPPLPAAARSPAAEIPIKSVC
ncbi:MAG TPA: hypothetical protein VHC39_15610 [Rhizomicrobium sp.]|nr:hypothetical protein [Rhizomicrobium sp.]